MIMRKKQFIGRTVLVGINFLDHDRSLLERYETHGTIEEITNELIKISREEGKFQLPFREGGLQEARPGVYREKTTGSVIKNPDYLATLNLVMRDPAQIEYCKQHGYQPKGN